MRIAGESLGAKGAAALSATAIVAAVLAIHGYANPGSLGLTGSAALGSGHQTAGTGRPSPKASASASPSGSPSPKKPASQGPLLSSTSYGSFAYQLYPGSPSSTARLALAGFSFTATPSGSTVQFSLSVVGSGQPAQRKTYPVADHIYFIEASFGDDSGNAEYNFGDDGVVATDSTGHVVS